MFIYMKRFCNVIFVDIIKYFIPDRQLFEKINNEKNHKNRNHNNIYNFYKYKNTTFKFKIEQT